MTVPHKKLNLTFNDLNINYVSGKYILHLGKSNWGGNCPVSKWFKNLNVEPWSETESREYSNKSHGEIKLPIGTV